MTHIHLAGRLALNRPESIIYSENCLLAMLFGIVPILCLYYTRFYATLQSIMLVVLHKNLPKI